MLYTRKELRKSKTLLEAKGKFSFMLYTITKTTRTKRLQCKLK